VEKWGIPMLFFSWMPIIGDPLCLAGGYLRLALWKSIFMIFLGKFARYCVLLWLYAQPWAAAPV
jgi:membrane protein YqaA with SNARE-associated domain